MSEPIWDLGTTTIKLTRNKDEDGPRIILASEDKNMTRLLEMAHEYSMAQSRFVLALKLVGWTILSALVSRALDVTSHTILGTTIAGLIVVTAFQHQRLLRARKFLLLKLREFGHE